MPSYFSKTLGADQVVAVSRVLNKKENTLKLGADLYISTTEQVGWGESNAATLDLIISTVDSPRYVDISIQNSNFHAKPGYQDAPCTLFCLSPSQ